jgi:hypothetical protein
VRVADEREIFAVSAVGDVLPGAHRRLPAGIERYRNRYIVYDLSNFTVGLKHKNDNASLISQWKASVDKKGAVCGEGISVIPAPPPPARPTRPPTALEKRPLVLFSALPPPAGGGRVSFGDTPAPKSMGSLRNLLWDAIGHML